MNKDCEGIILDYIQELKDFEEHKRRMRPVLQELIIKNNLNNLNTVLDWLIMWVEM